MLETSGTNKGIGELEALRDLLHQQNTYIWKWDSQKTRVEIDELFYQKLHISPDSSNLTSQILSLVHPEDKMKWLRFIVNLKNLSPIETFEIQISNHNSQFIWFRVTTEPIGRNESRMGLILDITKDKEHLSLYKNTSNRIEKSIQNNSGLNIVIDNHYKIKHIHNPGKILGANKLHDWHGLTFKDILKPESQHELENKLEEITLNPNSESKLIVKTNSEYTKTEKCLEMVLVNKLLDPLIRGVIIDARDITSHIDLQSELERQNINYHNLSLDYENQNKKIKIKNEILELKNKEIEEANKKLISSEERFLSLSRIVDQAITIIENNTIVYLNDRLAQITGYPLEELYNMKITDLAAPGESCKKIPIEDENKEGYQINYWGFTKNGERKYFSNTFYTEKSPGKPIYEFIITTDKTKEKIQNELLRNNEMKLKATLESLQKYIIVIDSKGFIINYYKPSSVNYNVFDSSLKPIGKHYTDLPLPEEFIERILDTTIKVQNEGKSKTVEIPLEIKGKVRWYYVNISIRYSTTGQNIGWTLVMDDITKIKATEMQLKNREAQLFSLINHFPDIVCLKDNENRWILANKPLLELYGIKNKPYLLKSCRELATLYPENKILYTKCHETDIEAWHAGEQIKYDMSFDMSKEAPRSYEIIKVPIFDNEGNPNWLIMLGRDITNRKKMNSELKIAKESAEKADQLKTAFLTNMSHELRTPLNGIVGFSQLLKNHFYNEKEHDEFVDIIYDSSNLLLSIINDIIDLSRMETGQISFDIKPVNINELLKETFNSYKRQYQHKKISLHLDFPRNPREIIIDTDKIRLQQILNNLMANAYKFTKEGRIDITVDFEKNHKNLIISVADTGIGIPEKYHATIFERFRQVEEGYTREYGGAGLGLAISKKLAEVLGGCIKLQSEVGKGSTFNIILPYIQRPIEIDSYQQIPDIKFIKNKRVLAVEDDAGSYLLLKSIFQNTGCKLLHSKNGQEAIELLKKDRNIDLILMDMQMPVMDGLEATMHIKAMDSQIPIIAQTAHAFTNDREKCLNAGCEEFITKPIRFNELFNAMYKILVKGKQEA
jgi:PAS domain S-box-containing protein